MSQLKLFSIALLILFLSACSDKGLHVTAEFANTQDIAKGTKVYFGSKAIGEVDAISATDFGSKVELALDTELAQQVNTRAAVVVNRIRQGSPLELHNPPGPVRQPLQQGQELEALDSMTQLIGWGIGSSFKAGTESVAAFKDYLKSEEFERDKADIGIAIDQGLRSAKDGVAEAEQTIADALKEIQLTEEEMADVVRELGQELAPLAQEMAKGSTELMLKLEELAISLEQAEGQNADALFESFTEALEQLGESIDSGVEEGFDDNQSTNPDVEPEK